MKTTILSLATLVIALFSIHTSSYAQKKEKKPKDQLLGGKTYTVEITETTNKKVGKISKDEISFKSEKFNSKVLTSEIHFPPTPYTASMEADSTAGTKEITFSCEGTNADGEDVKVNGTISDDSSIAGSVVVSKKGKTKREFDITGGQKIKGAAKK